MDDNTPTDALSGEAQAQKIQSLRDMINSAEKTIHGAKAMLLQIEGKKKSGRRRHFATDDSNSQIVEGAFDGQIMIGTDGNQYPVPANYASKSKLVEGDLLKLTIVQDGSFIYKQIGPAPRTNKIGIVSQDENGNYFVVADGKPYKVLLASITYFKVEPGDEVVIVTAQDENDTPVTWAAIENTLQKAKAKAETLPAKEEITEPKTATGILTGDEKPVAKVDSDILDEWTPDIEEIEKEIQQEMEA